VSPTRWSLLAAALFATACGRGGAVAPDHVEDSAVSGGAASRAVRLDRHILVDQFGYRPGDPKHAVIRDPVQGYDADARFSPGALYQVRRAADGAVVAAGPLRAWRGGAVDPSSGDRGWWFDFSALNAPGSYFVFDPENRVRSPTFSVDQQVYAGVLKAALRTYFYQRSGIAKQTPSADACWTDAAAYAGAGQDSQARDIADPLDASRTRDLGGGWFDAGDTNKYVTNALHAVHPLLTAYQQNAANLSLRLDIPESGNGIPDMLNEIQWEIDWLEKMQNPDGSAALKVGSAVLADASPPSSDKSPRYFVARCSSSTIAVAGMFAHAALVYRGIPRLRAESDALTDRALRAWENFQGTRPWQTRCDSGAIRVAGSDLGTADQAAQAVVAAIYLYALTGQRPFDAYVQAHYRELRPYRDAGWSRYDPEQGDALLFYTTLPGADAAVRAAILAGKRKDVQANPQIYGASADRDLYRNYLDPAQYHWGSNEVRANYGSSNMDALTYGAAGADAGSNAAALRERALDTLHYFHGVNPFGRVYLTNMYRQGATASINEIFHSWFRAGSRWRPGSSRWSDALGSECGPPPGFLPGGPVADAAAAGIPASIAPPAGQPPQKSYRDWNGDGPDHSYIVNEPAIYYQAAYIRLLAHFAR
jgi:hypothetical protein